MKTKLAAAQAGSSKLAPFLKAQDRGAAAAIAFSSSPTRSDVRSSSGKNRTPAIMRCDRICAGEG
jgi:hypothetical protein